MLEIRNVSKYFRKVKAVDNLNFSVDDSGIFGILGPNGAGKTTILRIILGMLKPDQGEILYNGRKINEEFKNIVGYLPEERGLYQKSKVSDILKYFGKLKGIEGKSINSKIEFWLGKLEIPGAKDKIINELSKGNQQKIQFITSVLHEPEILILDELFSGFDPINQQTVRNILTEFIDNKKTIIISTHMMELAENLCSEILLINEGKKILQDDLNSLQNNEQIFNIKFSTEIESGKIQFAEIIRQINSREFDIVLNLGLTPSEFIKHITDNNLPIESFREKKITLTEIFMNAVQGERK